jgi:hypothetical protein
MNLNQITFIVGIFGDFLLQIIVRYHPNGDFAGLKSYFTQHGIFESLIIAGGMLYLFMIILDLLKIKKTYINLGIYGGILDILFRYLRIFPSLDGYYKALTVYQSILWGAIPMMLPLLSYKLYQ